jgi:hypothetical protein
MPDTCFHDFQIEDGFDHHQNFVESVTMKFRTIAGGAVAILLLSSGAYAQGTGPKPCPPGQVASRAGDTGNPPESQTKKAQELARRGADTGNPPASQTQEQSQLARRGADTGNPPDSQVAASTACE